MKYTLLLSAVLMWPSTALAYLDPFSGSLLIQGLIAGALMATYFVKKKWRQLCALFGGKSKEDSLEDMIDSRETSQTSTPDDETPTKG